jgi:integrase
MGTSPPYSLSESATKSHGEALTGFPTASPTSEEQAVKITRETVAGLTLADGKKDSIHFDDALPGFGLRLRRSGDKVLRSYVAQYKRARQTRRILLGSADVLSAEKARAAAKHVLAKVALGEDPQQQRVDRREKDRLTLRGVVADFLAAKEEEVRPKTYAQLERYLTGPHFKPLHAMPVDTVTRRDVAARLVVIKREHGATSAVRARTALSSTYTWAMKQGLVESNPTINAGELPPSKARERVLSDEELVKIWNATDRPYGYDRIVRLLLLTAARRQEVGSMSWGEIKDGVWTIPAHRAKNGKAHALPLLPMAAGVIASVPRIVGREALFGTKGTGFFGGFSRCKQDLDKRCRVSDWHLHDLRRTAATKMADIGVLPHVIEAVLNHHGGHKAGVAGIYNRSTYEREVRNALALWEDRVRALAEGGEQKILSFKPLAS